MTEIKVHINYPSHQPNACNVCIYVWSICACFMCFTFLTLSLQTVLSRKFYIVLAKLFKSGVSIR